MRNMTATGLTNAVCFCFVLGAASSAFADYAQPQSSPNAPAQTQVISNGPQASAGDSRNWSARRDIERSAEYEHLLMTDMTFRRQRERKECGPITDAELHQQCMASFDQYEPIRNASLVRRHAEPRRFR